MKPTRFLMTALAMAVLIPTISAQKGKPTKPPQQSAALTFRCAFSTDPLDPCPVGSVPDGIRGDTPTSYASLLDGLGEAYLELTAGGGRFLWLDFRNGPQRLPSDRRHFDILMLDRLIFHTNVVDASGNEVEGGLRTLAVGQSSASRLKIAFNTISPSGESIAWAVRFNPDAFPGSDHLTVTRLSSTTWEIEATAADRAVLVSGVRRTQIIEGPFAMPFTALLTLPPS